MNEPVPNSPQAIEQAWDHLAEEYAQLTGPSGNRRALAAIELAVVMDEIPEGTACRILDAGGGPGYHATKLAGLGHSLTVIDISARMLAITEQAAKRAGVGGRIKTVKADIRTMDALLPKHFDLVMACGTVVSDCGSPRDALLAFSKVLRPDGKACFSVRGLNSVPAEDPGGRALFLEKGTRVIRGHQAFDWHLFSRRGIERLCDSTGLSLLRTMPVGCQPPPPGATGRDLEEYVRQHLGLTDNETALEQAAEIMVVAARFKGDIRSRLRESLGPGKREQAR